MATFDPVRNWQSQTPPPESKIDWPLVIAATVLVAVLAIVVALYVYPASESGRFDRCVQQRAEIFLEKTHFPVIPAVSECTELRDQGALAN
ncbi:MAG: hypothetical protein U0R81_15890 [Mycobacterium sp.]